METDLSVLYALLPESIVSALPSDLPEDLIIDFIFDLGKPVRIRTLEQSFHLSKVVTHDLLRELETEIPGEFDYLNRRGIRNTLHRVSCLRNTQGTIIGYTLRIGRPLYGIEAGIRDILETGSTLILGIPGVGKTSMLRGIARYLSIDLAKEVMVVDKSNEIAGFDDVPHKCIGNARRLQAAGHQYEAMKEAVENHTPQVIIVDEIRDYEEAQAAISIRERGVELIATAHGKSLIGALRNPALRQVLGGIHDVTLGDDTVERLGLESKTAIERRMPSSFDKVVELRSKTEIAIYWNVEQAIDIILQGGVVKPEIRTKTDTWQTTQQTSFEKATGT